MLTSPAHLQGKRCCVVPNVAVDYMALNGQHSLAAWCECWKSCHRHPSVRNCFKRYFGMISCTTMAAMP